MIKKLIPFPKELNVLITTANEGRQLEPSKKIVISLKETAVINFITRAMKNGEGVPPV